MRFHKHHPLLNYLGIFALFLIPILIIISIYKYQLSRSVWTENNRINLVFGEKPLFVATFNPSESKLTALLIPSQLYLKVPQNYGFLKAESLWTLSKQEKKSGQLAALTLQNFIGAPINGWIYTDSLSISDKLPTQEKIKTLLQQKALLTNLSYLDQIRFSLFLKKLPAGKIKIIDLKHKYLLQKSILPDKTEIAIINKKQLDIYLKDLLIDQNIQKEDLAVAIKNSSEVSGIGNEFSRILENLGARVISVENAKENEASTCLVKDPNIKWQTLTKIIALTGCQVTTGDTRGADIVLSLGKKTAANLY